MMQVYVSNEVRIIDPSSEILDWVFRNFEVANPEYEKRLKNGFSVWKCPEKVRFFKMEIDGGSLVLRIPYGMYSFLKECISSRTKQVYDMRSDHGDLDYGNIALPLYDYQATAVNAMMNAGGGILIGKCGSGKTQIGIGAAVALKRKTLWLTHTNDLLEQSYERASRYMPKEWLGKIAAGKVDIGSHITFATVQTLSKKNLEEYKYEWDAIIVDECHRVCGTADKAQMFYKTITSLNAKYKYGLTATLHRADGLIQSVLATLGPECYTIPMDAVADKTITPTVIIRNTALPASMDYLDEHGDVCFTKLIDYVAKDRERNQQIINDVISNPGHSSLILSDRISHLEELLSLMPDSEKEKCVMLNGKQQTKKAKELRNQAIEDMRTGKKTYLFATYGLAKEGLDIPRLDRLYLATPKKDSAVVEQSLGRISRVYDGKTEAICYDYVDSKIGMLSRGIYPKREKIYRYMELPVIYG